MPVGEEIAIIYCGIKGLLKDISIDKIKEFEKSFLDLLRTKYQSDVLDQLQVGKLDEEIEAKLREAAQSVASRF